MGKRIQCPKWWPREFGPIYIAVTSSIMFIVLGLVITTGFGALQYAAFVTNSGIVVTELILTTLEDYSIFLCGVYAGMVTMLILVAYGYVWK